MANEPYNYANTAIPGFIKQLSAPDLIRLKWMMAACFFVLFMSISAAAIYAYFRNKYYTQLVVIVYLALGFCSVISAFLLNKHGVSFQIGAILHFPETLVQSPLVLLMLFAGLLLYEKR